MSATDPGIDPGLVSRGLAQFGVSVAEPVTFERMGPAGSSITYLVRDAAGGRWAIRRPRDGGEQARIRMYHEASILQLLRGSDVPTAHVYGLGRAADSDGAEIPVMLMDALDGTAVDTIGVLELLGYDQRVRFAESLAEALAAIHSVDIAGRFSDKVAGLPYAQIELRRCTAAWERIRDRSPDESGAPKRPELESLHKRLAASAPEQPGITLVHGDFNLNNVMISPETGEVVTIRNWEFAAPGEPLADLTRLLTFWPQAIEDDTPVSALDGLPNRPDLARMYLGLTGRDPEPLHYWYALELWRAAVELDLAVATAGTFPQLALTEGNSVGERIELLIQRAYTAAEDAGI